MIRTAKEKDLPRIMDLLHQVNDVHAEGRPDLFVKGHTKYATEELSKIITGPNTPVFVYTDYTDTLLGYCFCIVQDHTAEKHLAPIKTLYIDDLCVDSECRGQHIGSKLYSFVKDYAKSNGFYNITLNVWSENPGAIKFYENIGLRPYKTGMEEILDPIS